MLLHRNANDLPVAVIYVEVGFSVTQLSDHLCSRKHHFICVPIHNSSVHQTRLEYDCFFCMPSFLYLG